MNTHVHSYHTELHVFDVAKGPAGQETVKRDESTELLVAVERHAQLLGSIAIHGSIEIRRYVLKALLKLPV